MFDELQYWGLMKLVLKCIVVRFEFIDAMWSWRHEDWYKWIIEAILLIYVALDVES